MSKLVHAVLQGAALVIQVGNQYSGLVPAKYQPLVVAVVGLAQAALALSNHGGTNAVSTK